MKLNPSSASYFAVVSTTLISIIMPVKNADAWLRECVDSIISQTHNAWELIAVDDHSTDTSSEILLGYAEKDDRIRVHTNSGKGIIDALNTALNDAKGTLVTRMDADDTMPPDKLEALFDVYQKHPNSVITGKVKYFSNQPLSEGYSKYEHWLNQRCDHNDHWQWIYRECAIASANWLTAKEYVVFEKDVYPEDYNAIFYWYKQKLPVISTNQITHQWREHPLRTSRNSDRYQQKSFFDLKLKQFLNCDYNPSRPLALMGANQKYKLTAKWFKTQGIETEQIALDQLHKVGELIDPQILVCVYPAEELRDGIKDFLTGFGLKMGQDWWWL